MLVQKLASAIVEKKQIKCQYSYDEYSKEVLLEPIKIVNYEGFWYLLAVDSHEDILKKYYLKNINQINIQNETFESTEELEKILDNSISIWFDVDREPYRATLQISSKVAKYFKRKPISKTQRVESLHEDGSMIISVEITTDMEIIPLVQYWIPHIKVLEPVRINETIEMGLREYLGGDGLSKK